MSVDELVGKITLHRENQTRAVRAALEALLVRGQRGVVLADEVGCGKTYEALAIAALLWAHHRTVGKPVQRILIVADGPLMTKWFNEIEVHGDESKSAATRKGFQQYVQGAEWQAFRAMLDQVERLVQRSDGDKRGVNEAGKRQVPPDRVYIAKPKLLTGTGEDTTRYLKYIHSSDWDVLIVDEAHNFTGLHTQRSKVFFPGGTAASRLEGLSARYVLALTATPFQLATTELLHLLRVVHADANDLETLDDALPRFEAGLDRFYAKRQLPPDADARKRAVDALARLRLDDACDGRRPGAPGLEPLLRRYLIRNVKDPGQRDYKVTERLGEALSSRGFGKLDDVRTLVSGSPLVPLEGLDAWVYMQVRDLIADANEAARGAEDRQRGTFVAGDLRQCLSSYEQLAESALLTKKGLARAPALQTLLARAKTEGHLHPKIAALCAIVDAIMAAEIERVRRDPGKTIRKILIFNTLNHTAKALRDALQETIARRLNPFIDEYLRRAGWSGVEEARRVVRAALKMELGNARDRLEATYEREHIQVDRALLEEIGLESKGDTRSLVDVLFGRAEDHCSQPLFLLRVAKSLVAQGVDPTADNVQPILANTVGERLIKSIDRIVDDFLDDKPATGVAFSEENRAKAQREIARVARILANPDLVGRFDGETDENQRELRKENFNRPYAPVALLVSRVGEEGIDLQAHTHYVLHYDIEWNPAKMEQREGRVDREGRRSLGEPVQVQFFLLKDTYEERVFHTVMQRHAWFEILIGSKKKELAKGIDVDEGHEAQDLAGEEETGRLTAEERSRVMLDLQPT